jgi:hypothetical protein
MPNGRAEAVEGETTRLLTRFTLSNALYDPFSIEDVNVYAEDPTANPSAIAVTTITPTKLSTGQWYIDYTFDTPGVYYDKWRYVANDGLPTTEVVETVAVNTLPTSTEKDWTLLATWENELNTVNERISDLSRRVDLKDGSLSIQYMNALKELRKYKKEVQLEIMKLKVSAGTGVFVVPPVRDGWDEK